MKKIAKATEINRRIKLVRERAGLTQKTFSERIGVSRSFLSEIEAGKVKPSLETLIGVATRFGIDAGWLLIGIGSERASDAAAESSSEYRSAGDQQRSEPLIPLLSDQVVQGPPHPISEDDIAAYLPALEPITQKEAYCFYLRDDAMEPLIRRGALIGILPAPAPFKKWEGKLVALWPAKGGLTVRRLRIDQKYFIFEAENKSHPVFYLERTAKPVLFGLDWWWQDQKEPE